MNFKAGNQQGRETQEFSKRLSAGQKIAGDFQGRELTGQGNRNQQGKLFSRQGRADDYQDRELAGKGLSRQGISRAWVLHPLS